MSTTIDQKVVEMRFDNKHFEKNVSTTMSTLDKLKHALRLDGSTKGLENVSSAAKKVDMSGLSKGVDTVQAKFSALEVMGVTALANITNSAVNAGKRIVSALTIDPIKTGLSEYETQINAVQTILANTQSKGTTLDDVNAALDELNKYADKTIYNFTEMTRNIGTFTAAGVDLETSVKAIQGIANLAAVSGSDSTKASTAMYQLSQALAAGRVSLTDWNSVVNAGMGGEVFQNALTRTAKAMGTDVDAIIEQYGSFRDSLTRGEWLTTDVLTKTLEQFTMAAEEGSAEWENFKKSLMDDGYTADQAEEILKMANTATDAATKVKTFTQLWDTLKETAQSGWTQTWEYLIGDFEAAKETLSQLGSYLGGIVDGWSDIRNSLIGGAFNMKAPWGAITEKLENSNLFKVVEKVENVTDKLSDFQKVVNQVWRGDYGNADTGRFEALEKLGYHSEVIQDLVNKGENYKLTVEDIEASYKKFGLELEKTKVDTDALNAAMDNLTDEQLESAGLTKGEIRLYRALAEESKKTGKSISEIAKNMSELDGRTLMIESLKNIWKGLVSVLGAVRDAWEEVFPPITVVQLYNVITGFNKLTERVAGLSDRAEDFKRVFKGVFALLDIVAYIVGGPLKIGFELLKQILGVFNLDILDGIAGVGDLLVKFRDWIKSTLDFTKAFERIKPAVLKAVDAIKKWLTSVPEAGNIPHQIIQGLINGFKDGIPKVGKIVWDFGKMIIAKICEVLGIHSPSRVFFMIGTFIVLGLIAGIKSLAPNAWNTIKGFGEKCIGGFENAFSGILGGIKKFGKKCAEEIKKLDFGKILVGGLLAGSVVATIQIANAIAGFASAFEGLGDMFEGIGVFMKGIGKSVRNYVNSAALINFAIAIGVLAASLLMLSKVAESGQLWNCVGAIAALSVIMVGLTILMSKFGDGKVFSVSPKAVLALVAIAGAMLLLALAMAKFTDITPGDIGKTIAAVVVMVAGIGTVMALSKRFAFVKMGGTIFAMAAFLLMMVGAIKILSGVDAEDAMGGLLVIAIFQAMMIAILAVTKSVSQYAAKAGAMMLMMAGALLIMAGVIKILSRLDGDGLGKAFGIVIALELIFTAIIAVSKFAGPNAAKAGAMMLMMAGALLIMSIVLHIVSGLKGDGLIKAFAIVAGLMALFAGIIYMTLWCGHHAMKAGVMLLAMSGALLILSGVLYILSLLDGKGLAKGLAIVLALGAMFAGVIAATHHARKAMGSLIVLTIAISILAGVIIAMSFMDTTSLLKSTAAISIAMLSLAAVFTSLKQFSSLKSALKTVLAMTLLIGGLALILAMMSGLKVDNAIENAAGLSILMLSLVTTLKIISVTRRVSTAGFVALGVMAVIASLVALILKEMSAMNIQNGIENAAALSILMTGLAAACLIVSVAGTLGIAALAGVGIFAIFVLALAELLRILGGLSDKAKDAIENGIPVLKSLGTGLGEFIGGFIGGVFDAAILDRLPAIGEALSGFMTNVQPFIDGARNCGWDVLKGITSLSAAILALTAAEFIADIFTFTELELPAFGKSLADFMKNVQPFIAGAENIKPESMNGVKALSQALLALTTAKLIDGISKWIPFSGSLASFGAELATFGPHIARFSKSVENIDATTVTAAATAGKALAEMAAAIPNSGGLIAVFTGDNKLDKFGEKLEMFGMAMQQYAISVEGTNLTAINNSIPAAKGIIEIAEMIPNSGGVVSWFTGDNKMDKFGEAMASFANSMQWYSIYAVSINTEAITNSIPAAEAIIAIAEKIPAAGGVFSWFTGNNRFDVFGQKMMDFASSMQMYSIYAAGIDATAIQTSKPAVEAIIEIANLVPAAGGMASWFNGENRYNVFGEKMASFASAMMTYSAYASGIDAAAVTNSTAAVKSVIEIANMIPASGGLKSIWSGGADPISLGYELSEFARHIEKYSENVSGMNIVAIHDSNKAVGKLIDLIKNAASANLSTMGTLGDGVSKLSGALSSYSKLDTSKIGSVIEDIKALNKIASETAGMDFSSISSLGTNLGNLGRTGVNDFIKSFDGAADRVKATGEEIVNGLLKAIEDKYKKLSECGKTLINKFADGVNSKEGKNNVKIAINSVINSAISAIKSETNYSSFKSSGSYLMDGFIAGINSKRRQAIAAASAIAAATAAAMNTALKINSPSKITMKTGEGVVEGLVLGIHNLFGDAEHAGEDLAGRAASGLSGAISKLQDAVSMDFDQIQPVISPVLDLSEVSAGANSINGMFGIQPSVGVLSKVQSINATMSRRQNGGNSDVVSALKDLGRKFDTKTGDTYHIDGITYDDGSNVANAVQTLVRAARVGRRT
jgi:tape measure domain-containing protein